MRSAGHTTRSVRLVLGAAGVAMVTASELRAGRGPSDSAVIVQTVRRDGPGGPLGPLTTVAPWRASTLPEEAMAALRTLAQAYGATLAQAPRGGGWSIGWPP